MGLEKGVIYSMHLFVWCAIFGPGVCYIRHHIWSWCVLYMSTKPSLDAPLGLWPSWAPDGSLIEHKARSHNFTRIIELPSPLTYFFPCTEVCLTAPNLPK